jgi:glycosyltransferase involved in cell wall biosynthesis
MIVAVDARELEGQSTGTGRYLRNLLRAWDPEPGDDVVGYLRGTGAPLPEVEARGGRVRWRRVGAPRTRGIVWQERLLPAAVLGDRPSVFFAPAYHCPLRLPIPRVTTVHDLSYFFCPHDFPVLDGIRRRLLTAAAIHVSRAVVAVSAFTQREIARRFPGAAARVVHIPHGADDDLPRAPGRPEARGRLGLRGPLLLWVGSVFNRRWLAELLAATARLRALWPDLTLDVVGDNRTRPTRDFLTLVRDFGIEGNVRLSGFVSEEALALRYAAADVAVALSDYEGFGLPAVEAMARGVPLVAANRPSLDEVAAGAALFVEGRDGLEIAAAVDRILSNSDLARSLVARGREATSRLTWRAAARRTRAVLAEAARP